jgi:hypothetical protein
MQLMSRFYYSIESTIDRKTRAQTSVRLGLGWNRLVLTLLNIWDTLPNNMNRDLSLKTCYKNFRT